MLHLVLVYLPYAGSRHRPAVVVAPQVLEARLVAGKAEVQSDAVVGDVLPQSAVAADVSQIVGTPGTPAAEQTAGSDLLPFSAPVFYSVERLTRRPQPEDVAELDTEETKALVASGTVVLRLWIDARGTVLDVEIERSNLPEVFSRTAANAFRGSRFIPGELNGLRVGSIMRVEVNYDDSRSPGEPSTH